MDTIFGPGSFEWLGTKYRPILTKGDSGGSMSIVDSVSPPQYGPPRHIHHDADETFVVLSGECEIWIEGNTSLRGPGEAAFVPRGKEHTFRIIGDQPSRHLVILTPGGMEDFFAEMSREACRIPQDMSKITEAGQRYHLEFTGPPLGAE